MKISLLEPIGVSKEVLDELSKGLIERGHEFTFYDTKTTDVEELKKRSAGCDIVPIPALWRYYRLSTLRHYPHLRHGRRRERQYLYPHQLHAVPVFRYGLRCLCHGFDHRSGSVCQPVPADLPAQGL